jgi:hypothetical protein
VDAPAFLHRRLLGAFSALDDAPPDKYEVLILAIGAIASAFAPASAGSWSSG